METYEKFMADSIGKIGKAQVMVVMSIRIAIMPMAWAIIIMSYAGAQPKWWSTPFNSSSSGNSTFMMNEYEKICLGENSTVVYDNNIYTILNEWDLVCNRKWIVSAISTTQMVGVLVGAFFLGQTGSWFGRKKPILFSYLLMLATLFIASFSVDWTMMLVCAFFIGFACGGYLSIDFAYAVEFISTSWRTFFGMIPIWGIGVVVFACVFKIFPNWRHFFRVLAILSTPSAISLLLIPESPRWLFTQGRLEEGKAIIRRLANRNGLPEPRFECLESLFDKLKYEKKQRKHYTYWSLIKYKSTRMKALIFGLMWFYMASGYYGLTLGVSRLAGDMTVNMVIMGISEIFCRFLAWLLTKWFQRRNTTIYLMLASGISSFAVSVSYYAVPSNDFPTYMNVFSLSSRFFLTSAWASVIVHNAESFPTVIRTTAMGFSSVCGRVGGIIAPQYELLQDISTHIPFTMNGVLALVCAITCFMLDDTYTVPLEDHLESRDLKLDTSF